MFGSGTARANDGRRKARAGVQVARQADHALFIDRIALVLEQPADHRGGAARKCRGFGVDLSLAGRGVDKEQMRADRTRSYSVASCQSCQLRNLRPGSQRGSTFQVEMIVQSGEAGKNNAGDTDGSRCPRNRRFWASRCNESAADVTAPSGTIPVDVGTVPVRNKSSPTALVATEETKAATKMRALAKSAVEYLISRDRF